jgi:MFS superfamily sulfate permease-like transporter
MANSSIRSLGILLGAYVCCLLICCSVSAALIPRSAFSSTAIIESFEGLESKGVALRIFGSRTSFAVHLSLRVLR